MNRGPRPGSATVDYVAKAFAAWGPDAPDWVIVLARKAEEIGQAAAGALITYRASTISEVISKKYRGDLGRVEQMVRGALMSETVMCPVLDEIGRDVCLEEQSATFRATNSTRGRLRRACRTCQHREVKP